VEKKTFFENGVKLTKIGKQIDNVSDYKDKKKKKKRLFVYYITDRTQ